MISIITPCKNIVSDHKRLSFFYKLLDSIRKQTLQDYEHIIIDGDSQDGTKSVLEDISENGITIVSEPDKGIYEAMNKGVSISTGKYVIVMNSDDYFVDISYLEQSMSILDNSSEIDYVHANKLIVGRNLGQNSIKYGNYKEAFYRMPFRHNTMVVRRSVIDDIGLYDESFKIVSDYKFVLKLILAGIKGKHIDTIAINSLDGGLSSNRELCINEVSFLLYEIYGKSYNLTLEDCRLIYLREFSQDLVKKLKNNISNTLILESLLYGLSRHN